MTLSEYKLGESIQTLEDFEIETEFFQTGSLREKLQSFGATNNSRATDETQNQFVLVQCSGDNDSCLIILNILFEFKMSVAVRWKCCE